MIYRVEKIKQDVRIAMDQNMVTDELFESGDIDSLMLDEIIQSKLVEAVERVHMMAPYHLLELGHNFCDVDPDDPSDDDVLYWADKESGWVILPEDFMRLVVFEMSDWERPVYSPITQDDPEYAKQRSRIKALRGTAQRPVCALVVRPSGKVLEFYSCKSEEATVTRAVYVPYPKVDKYGGVDISERCYTAVVYMAAGLTLTSCGEADKAGLFFDMAKTYLEK